MGAKGILNLNYQLSRVVSKMSSASSNNGTNNGTLRWGIMGAGHISNDWAVGLSTLNPEHHKIIAVAARKLDSAQKFANEHCIQTAYGSYDELVRNPEIDVVYIGTIHSEHFRLGKLALDHGKHVLCEKPLCMNVKETAALISHARSKKLFLMEGIWSRFFPSYITLRELIDKGTIGDVMQVISGIGIVFAQDRDWRRSREFGGGTVLQLGMYNSQLATFVFKGLKPLRVVASGHLNNNGIDESSSATLIFPGGKTATLLTHSLVNLPNEAFIIGTKGTLKLQYPFWGPTKLETPNGVLEFPLPKSDKKINFWNTVGLCYQCEEVRRCIFNGLTESPYVTMEDMLLIAEIQESVRKQIGVVYPTD